MSSVLTYLQNSWSRSNPDAASKENWEATMDVVEKDRQRDRILAWRDRVGGNDCPVRRELAPWRSDAVCPNTTGPGSSRRALGLTQAAAKVSTQRHVSGRSHGAGGVSPSGPYLYNLEVYGHKVYSRRSAKDIASADEENSRRVEAGELGPLSPLD
ncbi:MAG: hypothetical protein WDW36_004496 [Sanguina aurantia]